MITLTANIDVILAIPNLRRWRVADFDDKFESDPVRGILLIEVLGSSRIYRQYTLYVYDALMCSGLIVNPTPQNADDQLTTVEISIPDAYTTFIAAYNGAGGAKSNRLRALEAVCLSSGLLSADFAGV